MKSENETRPALFTGTASGSIPGVGLLDPEAVVNVDPQDDQVIAAVEAGLLAFDVPMPAKTDDVDDGEADVPAVIADEATPPAPLLPPAKTANTPARKTKEKNPS